MESTEISTEGNALRVSNTNGSHGKNANKMDYKVKDISLWESGRKAIELAETAVLRNQRPAAAHFRCDMTTALPRRAVRGFASPA